MTIRTERLTLRPWVEEDLKPFAELNADIRVREHFPSVCFFLRVCGTKLLKN